MRNAGDSPNHGRRIVTVEGKKFAPLSSESPSLPIGTQFEAKITSLPGAAVIATTPKGNSLKMTQIRSYEFAGRQWNGEPTQIQVGFLSNPNPAKTSIPVALVKRKVLGVLDKQSVEKLKSANLLKLGATFSVSLQTAPGTTAYLKVDPKNVVYPHQQESQPTPAIVLEKDSQAWTIPDKLLRPADWAAVAIALGQSPKYVERVKHVTEANRVGLPLSEQALNVMQQDFNAYNQIFRDLREWHQAAKALGKSEAYQQRIADVAIAFHHPTQPSSLLENVVVTMQRDLSQYEQQLTQKLWQHYSQNADPNRPMATAGVVAYAAMKDGHLSNTIQKILEHDPQLAKIKQGAGEEAAQQHLKRALRNAEYRVHQPHQVNQQRQQQQDPRVHR